MLDDGPWANLWPLAESTNTLLGYRHVRRISTGDEGQASFTVVPNLLACAMTIIPTSVQVDAATHTGSITLTAPETRCVWTVQSNDTFISITSATSGAGSTSVTYSIAANSGTQRTGTVTVAGKTFTVTQSAAPLAAPMSLTATRQSTTSASITWSASQGATAYELFRGTTTANFTSLSSVAVSPFTDTTLSAAVTYLYKVRALNGSQSSAFSNVDLTTTVLFTDDPIVAGVTPVRAAHLTELRQAVNAVRTAAGLGAGTYIDNPAVAGTTVIKAGQVTELRSQLNDALVALGFSTPSYTDPSITAGSTIVKSSHIQELRNATK